MEQHLPSALGPGLQVDTWGGEGWGGEEFQTAGRPRKGKEEEGTWVGRA